MRKVKAKKIMQKLGKDKLLTFAILITVPSLFLWLSATLSFIYIRYVGPFIYGLSGIGEFIVFLALPMSGTVASFFSYSKNKGKTAKYFLVINTILFLFVLIGSFVLS